MNGLEMKYFVLSPLKDDVYGMASRLAMETYAKRIVRENEQLHDDIIAWLNRIRFELKVAE